MPTTNTNQNQNQTGSTSSSQNQNQTQTTNLSPEQRAALADRYGLVTGYLKGLPGVNQDDPWGSAGSYFGGQAFKPTANPYTYSPSGGFDNPLLRSTAQFYSDELGKIQAPKTNYNATANVYNPVDVGGLSGARDLDVSGNMSSAANVARETVGRIGTVGKEHVARTTSDAAIAAAKDIMSQIITPGVRAQLASSGMGRTGAEAEVTSQRGAEISLPIASQWQAEQARANELEANLGQSANNLTASLGQDAYNLQANLGQSANNLQANLTQSANNLNAQLKSNAAQVRFLEQSKAALQAQMLTATDASQARAINAQLATVDAQLAQTSQQTRAILAGKGVDMGMGLADRGAVWDMDQGKQQNQYGLDQQRFLLSLLQGTPMPGGGSVNTTSSGGTTSNSNSNSNSSGNVDAPNPPSNTASKVLDLAAIGALAGGPAIIQWIKSMLGKDTSSGKVSLTPNEINDLKTQFNLPIDPGGDMPWDDPFSGINIPNLDPGGDLGDFGIPEPSNYSPDPDWWDIF